MVRITRRSLTFIVFLVLATTLVAPAGAEPPAGPEQANVQVTVRIGKLEGGRRVTLKSYDLVVVSGGAGSRLLSGTRVPIPTALSREDDEEKTAYSYQNVGFSSDVRAWVLADERIKLTANIEDSRLVDGGSGDPPIVETRQLAVDAILEPGKPLEVTRVEGVTDQAGFVEIEARRLR